MREKDHIVCMSTESKSCHLKPSHCDVMASLVLLAHAAHACSVAADTDILEGLGIWEQVHLDAREPIRGQHDRPSSAKVLDVPCGKKKKNKRKDQKDTSHNGVRQKSRCFVLALHHLHAGRSRRESHSACVGPG